MGTRREPQILGLIGMSIAFKFFKLSTWDEFVGTSITMSKLAVVVLYIFIDVKYAVFYCCLCLVLWVLLKQPKYRGPNKTVKFKDSEEFYEQILKYDETQIIVGQKSENYFKQRQKEMKKQLKRGEDVKN